MALERWEIDSGHSGIHFSVRHMVVAKVRGQFARWSGTILAEDGDLARASVEAVMDASSIETGVADRDAHLKSPDFLNVASYPALTFRSKGVERLGGDRLRVLGDLTIRGVTREVALDVEYAGRTKDPWGNERAGFTAKTSIDRGEFGLIWNQMLEAGGLMVGERVDIEIEVEAVKQTAVKAA
ncbi:MAG: YceI family protein [Gemmatimonadetes bacterium]|nr:YceI family protein [Gemmatimonadota bacterium]